MVDTFKTTVGGMESPASFAHSVTPHDTTELPAVSRSLYVGTGGDITVTMAGSNVDQLFKNVPTGYTLGIRVTKVKDTGTTAEDIVSIW